MHLVEASVIDWERWTETTSPEDWEYVFRRGLRPSMFEAAPAPTRPVTSNTFAIE
jgi:hypothetical protein